jgi:hypothetical protein
MPQSVATRESSNWLIRCFGSGPIWCAVAVVLVTAIPLVVRSPLTSDTVMFDLQAQTVLNGGVLYRDVLEPNFPGIVWCHLVIRSVGGWSSEWIRIADVLIVGTAIVVLLRIAVNSSMTRDHGELHSGSSRNTQLATACFFAALFYLSRNEWCHCQRDAWMLLPVSMAMWLHGRTISRETRSGVMKGLLEGVCWSAAFWIKPHVALPALSIFAVKFLADRDHRRVAVHLLTVVGGGVLIAVPGILWLVATDAWHPFLQMQLHWNPEYLAAGADRRSVRKLWFMLIRFHPWWIVHVAAIPVAVITIRNAVRHRRDSNNRAQTALYVQASLGALYLGWLVQACVLQHAMDYIQVPPVLLGITVLAGRSWRAGSIPLRCSIAAFAAITIAALPFWNNHRIGQWTSCITAPASWQQRETLAQGRYPAWNDVGQVVEFLGRRNVLSGDVTCYTTHSVHVYAALNLLPSTRYVGVSTLLELFPTRSATIESTVQNCGAQFVVTDNDEVSPRDGFPWNLPIVFESGSLRVHATIPSPSLDQTLLSNRTQ